MRKKPIRGEKLRHFPTGQDVIMLDAVGKDHVKILLPSGMISSVPKSEIDLPIIDTAFYEKIVLNV